MVLDMDGIRHEKTSAARTSATVAGLNVSKDDMSGLIILKNFSKK